MLHTLNGKSPKMSSDVFVAEGAQVIGDVTIGRSSSVWFNAVIRGDLAPVIIGERCNIQDLAMIHVNIGQPTILEDDVSIGHSAILHGCRICRASLIGMGAIILNNSVIGEESLVAAGALIPENKTFPPRVLIIGSPAKVARELTEAEIQSIREASARYSDKAQEYLTNS